MDRLLSKTTQECVSWVLKLIGMRFFTTVQNRQLRRGILTKLVGTMKILSRHVMKAVQKINAGGTEIMIVRKVSFTGNIRGF